MSKPYVKQIIETAGPSRGLFALALMENDFEWSDEDASEASIRVMSILNGYVAFGY